MKTTYKFAAIVLGALSFALAGCSDFEEVNTDPNATQGLSVQPYFALNNSIIGAQQNPDIAERLFIINWAKAARHDGQGNYGNEFGNYNDDHNGAAYDYMSKVVKSCMDAITLSNLHIESGKLGDHASEFIPNVLQFARIWRVYLMSEFADSFGPMPVKGFMGVNPEFNSTKETYYHFYEELADAIAKIDTNVKPTADEEKCDPAYKYDAAKWKNYGISLWMRLAMRLSEADAGKAQIEFEKAVAAGPGIRTADQTFRVKEKDGWDDLSGVISRKNNYHVLTATAANLTTNLGGVKAEDLLKDASGVLYTTPDIKRYTEHKMIKELKRVEVDGKTKTDTIFVGTTENRIKDASTYLGRKYASMWLDCTDNPTKQIVFDGIPANIDPRAFVYFALPGDSPNRKKHSYFPTPMGWQGGVVQGKTTEDGKLVAGTETDWSYAWNGLTVGWRQDQTAMKTNGLLHTNHYTNTIPTLAEEFRDNTNQRVFLGPWETYFLLSEAAVRGWNTGGASAEGAYNDGIKASLDYNGVGTHYSAYIASENYNRVGTSVKFSHTTEPAATQMDYINGETGAAGKITYEYPNASKILYAGGKLNDQLTKIITQKYIANMPWLPLENWSEHRRLGLPFWEIPAATNPLTNLPEWTITSYQSKQKAGYFPQRMQYPSSLSNADPAGYAKAVELLGGQDKTVTPLWWAIGGKR